MGNLGADALVAEDGGEEHRAVNRVASPGHERAGRAFHQPHIGLERDAISHEGKGVVDRGQRTCERFDVERFLRQ